ncbi:MAG: hypothetical protein K8I29_08755 [Alphaproteobacteria bacterium]|uniref:Uncharacterized protein n=1 Tax=Candidatus Nitrobium versatile TaxID=2884831 RepID=A0A953J4T9_9BACT|nr:hypothetical protein [Candidatus Nitrobium versatile]
MEDTGEEKYFQETPEVSGVAGEMLKRIPAIPDRRGQAPHCFRDNDTSENRMAERQGFEPWVGYNPTTVFECDHRTFHTCLQGIEKWVNTILFQPLLLMNALLLQVAGNC